MDDELIDGAEIDTFWINEHPNLHPRWQPPGRPEGEV